MKITEIKKLKRLYKVTFDDFFDNLDNESTDKLYVTEDTIVKFMLSKGKDIDASQLTEIESYANFSRGKNLAIYYISFKVRTRHEVEKYLREHEIPERDIPRILAESEQLGLINDAHYAESYISGRILQGTTGPYNIRQKLQQKGINPDLIATQLELQFPEEKQILSATKIAEKQVAVKFDRLPLKQLQQKIQQSLVSKGFAYSIAAIAVESLELTADEENEEALIAAEADKAYTRLARRYDGYDLKNRVSQTLARKGFDWSMISDALRDYEF